MNSNLAVSAVIIDVGECMQTLRFLDRGQRCGVGKKDLTVPNPIGTLVCDIFANWLSGPPESSPDQRIYHLRTPCVHAPAYTLGATSGGLLLAPGRMWVSVTARMRVGASRRLIMFRREAVSPAF